MINLFLEFIQLYYVEKHDEWYFTVLESRNIRNT